MNTYLCPIIEDGGLSIQVIDGDSKSEALYNIIAEFMKNTDLSESDFKEFYLDGFLCMDSCLEYLKEYCEIQIGDPYDIDYFIKHNNE